MMPTVRWHRFRPSFFGGDQGPPRCVLAQVSVKTDANLIYQPAAVGTTRSCSMFLAR